MESSDCDTNNICTNNVDASNLNEATPTVALGQEISNDSSYEISHVECDNAISSTTSDKFVDQLDPTIVNMEADTDTDLFAGELSMSNVTTEKITENVEDIVQDLENLLGDTNDSYHFPRETSFDNSKLIEGYEEVNSSNVDLFEMQDSNMGVGDLDLNTTNMDCEILSEAADEELPQSDLPISEEVENEVLFTPEEATDDQYLPIEEDISEGELVLPLDDVVSETSVLPTEEEEILQNNTLCTEEVFNADETLIMENSSELETNLTVILPEVKGTDEPLIEEQSSDVTLSEYEEQQTNETEKRDVVSSVDIKTVLTEEEVPTPEQSEVIENNTILPYEEPTLSEEVLERELIQVAMEQEEAMETDVSVIQEEDVDNEVIPAEIDQKINDELIPKELIEQDEDINITSKFIQQDPVANEEMEIQENLVESASFVENEASTSELIEPEETGEDQVPIVNEQTTETISNNIETEMPCMVGVNSELKDTSDLNTNLEEDGFIKEVVAIEEVNECTDVENQLTSTENVSEVHSNEVTSAKDNEEQQSDISFETNMISIEMPIVIEDPISTEPIQPQIESTNLENELKESTVDECVSFEIPESTVDYDISALTANKRKDNIECETDEYKTDVVDSTAISSNVDDLSLPTLLNVDDVPVTSNQTDDSKEISESNEATAKPEVAAVSHDDSQITENDITSNQCDVLINTYDVNESQVTNIIKEKIVLDETENIEISSIHNVHSFDYEGSEAYNQMNLVDSSSSKETEKPSKRDKTSRKRKSEIVVRDDYTTEETLDSEIVESSNKTSEEDVSNRKSEVIRPLTVEVEDSDYNVEDMSKATSTHRLIETHKSVVEDDFKPQKAIEVLVESQVDRAPLKMTITKHKSENTHSILKIYDPTETELNHEQIPKLIIKSSSLITSDDCIAESTTSSEEPVIPRITIKPIISPVQTEHQHSPKITIKPIKPPPDDDEQCSPRTSSPRITIKPIIKPETLSPLKLTLRPYPKVEDVLSSPKLNIKPIIKPSDEMSVTETHHSPKITIKPIIKPPDEYQTEEKHSPRITIKPIVKPIEEYTRSEQPPRITIKPIIKPPEDLEESETSIAPIHPPIKLNIKPVVKPIECSLSPKITIKPVPKPPELKNETMELIDFEDQIKQERIVLKIPKNIKKDQETEKLGKIKVKLSKEDGLAHIVPSTSLKRSASEEREHEAKYMKTETGSDLTISLVSSSPSVSPSYLKNDLNDFTVMPVPQVLPDDDSVDPLAEIPVFEITLESASTTSTPIKELPVAPATPRKRGRPRKVPLEVREDFKDVIQEEVVAPVEESTRPKRSCRGASVRATLGIKPRKPRAPSRGRGGRKPGSGRGGNRKNKERKTYAGPKTKSMIKETELKELENKDAEFKQVPLPVELGNRDVVIYEEETRMSAENTSRAQTPAKQVALNTTTEVVEESQSSVQSNTTTESGEKVQKVRKNRLEVHQEPEGEVISADKLAEYSWGGGGPYMLQEQVAQFLGIKSFKRKYPGIHRRTVDMQERDFIRESCLASEAMCDMGLTAVKSEDILDIMYTDFQNKYEEYCKHQRDRQAKDVSNKQKALSLAASQEKNKLDIVEQAVQSAFQWNATFNKARKEQRRACMDLQTFTVHFPKGRMKQVNKPPVGNHPLALVPGQFSDYYKKYNAYELNNFPLNTLGCKTITVNHDTEDSQSDGSGSDSESSSSDSDSSSSASSEDCKMCSPIVPTTKKVFVH